MMEKRLKFARLLSLEEMALRRVAINLWRGSDAWQEVDTVCTPKGTWLNRVKENVLKLELPESLRKQVNDIVLPIGTQIFKWEIYEHCTSYHEYLLQGCTDRVAKYYATHDRSSSLLKLCWTTPATIDVRKTAEELVRCNELDVVDRYRMACEHCLEDYIPRLWEELDQEGKYDFSNTQLSDPLPLPFCWPHILKGDHSYLDNKRRRSGRNSTSFWQYAFECSVEKGNETAAEYFLQKLTPEERDASLMRTAHAVIREKRFPVEKVLDILCYLLSSMSPDQQMEISTARPVDVLVCFLVWPRQDLFLENARFILTFLPSSRYAELVGKMSYQFLMPCHYFPKLFLEFLRQGPLGVRRAFFDNQYFGFPAVVFLESLLKFDDSDSIKALFRYIDAADRVKIMMNGRFWNYCCSISVVGQGKWPLVELCLREAALSRQDRERLKDVARRRFPSDWRRCICPDFKRVLDFIDEADTSAVTEKKAAKLEQESGSPEQ